MSDDDVFSTTIQPPHNLLKTSSSLLDQGGTVVDVGLPSEDEAVAMLLAAAGAPDGAAAPAEARAVVRLCKRLVRARAAGRPGLLSLSRWLVLYFGTTGTDPYLYVY